MGHRTFGMGGMSIFAIISNTHPHNLFFLCASHSIWFLTVHGVLWVDADRVEVQVVTAVRTDRICIPVVAEPRHGAWYIGLVVAIA